MRSSCNIKNQEVLPMILFLHVPANKMNVGFNAQVTLMTSRLHNHNNGKDEEEEKEKQVEQETYKHLFFV